MGREPNADPGAVIHYSATGNAHALAEAIFGRICGNFDTVIAEDAKVIVRRSADRHIGWVRGDFDHLA